jgi:hypothetical protein
MMDSRGKLKVAEGKHPVRRQICPVHMAETFSDKTIRLQALSLTLDDSSADMRGGDRVDVTTLAKNFGIGIEATKRTRLVTT